MGSAITVTFNEFARISPPIASPGQMTQRIQRGSVRIRPRGRGAIPSRPSGAPTDMQSPRPKAKPIVYVDMDGVIADYFGDLYRLFDKPLPATLEGWLADYPADGQGGRSWV